MYTAIVWIGTHGSWSKAGFASASEAWAACREEIFSGAFGDRTDLKPEVKREG
jgi:hypothetical protein